MPRSYKSKPGAKTYRKYDDDVIKQALKDLRTPITLNEAPSITSVAKKHGIPFSVLQRHNNKCMKSQGGQPALTPEAEEHIIKNLNICADWGYPLERIDLRHIVKMYLDSSNITVSRFKNNFPGPDFAESFLNRHSDKISKRISQNIKISRAKVSSDTLKAYFTELEKSLEGVPLSNILNYDESNLADDPGREKVIVRRGCKYPEKVRNHSKGCVSLMIAANAEGELLPPYVVYKSTHLYDTWTKNGPIGTRYNRSSSGWFDGPIFVDWVETIVIPYFDKKEGKKILIGDNLSSHLSLHLITKCKEKNIDFVFLPPNSTHITQPLDVAYFRPMKQAWRQLLQNWKKNDGRCLSSIPKGCFPNLLKMLLDQLKPNTERNIRSGFRKTGIAPLNCQEVLSRLPNETENVNGTSMIDESFIKILKEMRYGTMNLTEPKKKKKLEVVAGKSVNPEELFSKDEKQKLDNNDKKTGKITKSKLKQSKKQKLIPISLNTPLRLNVQPPTVAINLPEIASTSTDIDSMPIILAENLYFTQEEEVYEGTELGKEGKSDITIDCSLVEKENLTIQTININEIVANAINAKSESKKVKILSDEILPNLYSIKRKGKPSKYSNYNKSRNDSSNNQNVKKITNYSNSPTTASTTPLQINRGSSKNENYYNNADDIFKVLFKD